MRNLEFILIADGGSSKVEWSLTDSDGHYISSFETAGFNPLLASDNEAEKYFLKVSHKLPAGISPSRVYYYGAGCATREICERVAHSLHHVWQAQTIEVESDMLAACRALLGDRPGIVCILGTGSNSALYDGSSITANIAPLGYILGDEGSGTALGKRLISDIFKGLAPLHIIEDFNTQTGLTKGEVLEKTYRSSNPNKFLASFVPFIHQRIGDPYISEMVSDIFQLFFSRNVLPYHPGESTPVNFIGSVAANFAGQLSDIGADYGLTVGDIQARPMPGLIKYHNPSI